MRLNNVQRAELLHQIAAALPDHLIVQAGRFMAAQEVLPVVEFWLDRLNDDETALSLAWHHADAIADTNEGYTISRGRFLKCCWCDWYTVAPTVAEAVEQYCEHEDYQYDLLGLTNRAVPAQTEDGQR